jgi:hypothetical protein
LDRFRTRLQIGPLLLIASSCAPHYLPFATNSVALLGVVAAPGDGLDVSMGVGPTWIELDVRNVGSIPLWVSIDGVTVTGPDGRDHAMVESAVLNQVASQLAAMRYTVRVPPEYLVSRLATDLALATGELRGPGDRTAAVEPGKRIVLLLHPVEYLRLDGSGITPFPAPFWGGSDRDEGGELTVVLPLSWGRTWGRMEIRGRLGS